jgi:hypothetical protein
VNTAAARQTVVANLQTRMIDSGAFRRAVRHGRVSPREHECDFPIETSFIKLKRRLASTTKNKGYDSIVIMRLLLHPPAKY